MTHAAKRKIRLLVVDDHEVIRAGVRFMLKKFEHVEIVGEAGTVADAVKEALRLKPDVILLDVRLPDGTGFEVCRQLRLQNLEARTLVFSVYSDDDVLAQVVANAADGFLVKDATAEALMDGIDKVSAGQAVLDPMVTRRVLEQARASSETPADKTDLLSVQEKKVLALVADGKTNKEIGFALGLSDKTVKNYLANAMEKLQMNRRSQAAVYFTRQQLKQPKT